MAESGREKACRIVISGYYGFRNSGDEAVLRSILLALQEQGEQLGVRFEPVVLSADPAWTAQMYGVEAVPRMHPQSLLRAIRSCDALISGGGSLLQDATGAKTIPYYTGVLKLAQWLRKPTFIYSQGVGPVNRRWMDPLIANVMKKSKYISVRDAESGKLLERMGVPASRIEVVPDPVMGLPLPADAAAHGAGAPARAADSAPVVGVSLRRWRSDGADLDRAADALAALAASRPVRLRFLPFHTPDDAEASQYVMERLKGRLGAGSAAELAQPGDDPQRMLLEVSRCDLLFGMRLHALIYAANQQVPMLGLSYDPKIDQFLARLGLTAIGTTEALKAEAFAAEAGRLLDGRDDWIKEHSGAIERLRQQSQQPAKQIAELLRQTILR
ncbi:polysaccharide pyruvyl transferase CsaB [Paenibacillus protaetiae]|uniref:Polysaccharide pyruvyl transferase CsaB n=1 Tax=Paenibacillus protaetiae TaxID=2509456 RepID=A0A4P6EYE2_9BACL|nr:polysaccharide pyruvyl transferase CsaB [Paenibacillus protaetiae]QAY67735.1 polysaccharide pyruvyl transferase CsaB [Paenibacillus protaetiae]